MKRIAKKTAIILWLVLKTSFLILGDMLWVLAKVSLFVWAINAVANKSHKGKS